MSSIERLVTNTQHKLEVVRDSLAAVAAYSAAGEPKPLLEAAARLTNAVDAAREDCARVQSLLRRLDAAALPDAAVKLCAAGRPAAARAMMQLHELMTGTATAQAELGAFLEECLSSLEATQAAAASQAGGGRLLGSA